MRAACRDLRDVVGGVAETEWGGGGGEKGKWGVGTRVAGDGRIGAKVVEEVGGGMCGGEGEEV